MRYFLYGLAAFVVLLVAAALIGPRFVDWNAHKPRLAAEVRAATGRDLSIEGDISLAILPAPALSADEVRFANISGGTEPLMAEARELRIRIALLPLIRGRIQVESVSLVAPKILLEKLADGRRNWALGGAARPDKPAGPAVASSESELPGQVQLDSFIISDGTLIYRDAASGREERVEQLDAEIVAESLSGPLTTRGSAVVRDVKTEFDLAVGRIVESGATPFNLALRLPEAAAETQFAGSISLHPETLRFRGHLRAKGDNLAAGLEALSGGGLGAWPGLTGRPFVLHSDLSGDLAEVAGSEVHLQLGDAVMSGDASIKIEPQLDATLSLIATRIDLDQFLALEGSDESKAAEPSTTADRGAPAGAAAESPFTLPNDIRARLELAVEGLVYRGQAMRQLRFDASLQDGKITIGQAMTLLPGGSDLSLTGVVSPGDSGLRFSGRVESVSDNFRGLAYWLGADLAAVPPARLRRMSFTSQIEASRQQVELKSIDLRVDLTRITGGIVAAMRRRIGLGIGLAVDKINLDAYLPAPADAAETESATAEPAAPPAAESNAGQSLLALLDRFDANLDFRVGSLTYQGAAAKDLRLDGTLQNGSLIVRQASIGALPGARAAYSGEVRGLAGVPSLDGELEVEVADPRRLAKAFRLGDGLLTRLGRFTLKSGLKGNGDDLRIDGALSALGGRLGLAGAVRPNAGPLEFDMAVEARHPDLPGLIKTLGGAPGLTPDFGGLDMAGQFVGTPLDFDVSDLAGELGPVELSGQFSAQLAGPKPLIRANLAAGDLPLAALMAPAGAAKKAGAEQAKGGGTGSAPSRWSREPLDLAAWNAFDAELGLTARRVRLERTDLEDVTLTAELRDGVLNLERLNASLYGGALQVIGKVAAKDSLEAGLAVAVAELDLGKLLREQADFKRVSGPVSLNAELTTSGNSEAELIAALGGKGDLTGTLEVKVKQEERIGALALDLLGNKVREVRNVGNAMTTLLSGFAGAPAGLAGTFTVDKGVLVTEDARIDGSAAHALTRATADLPAWRVDSQTDVFRASDPDTPYLTANLKGPLDGPDVRIGGLPFKSPGQAPASGQGDQPNGALAPAPPKKLNTQDVLKDLLKGLKG